MTTEGHDINWFEVAECFYHACGGKDGLPSEYGLEYLCDKYAEYFEEDEEEECPDCPSIGAPNCCQRYGDFTDDSYLKDN